MDRKEMIFEIMNLYEENAMLNIELNELKKENIKIKANKQDKELNSTDYKMVEIAKKLLLKKCLYSWNEANVVYDEEKDTYTARKYECWLENKLINNEIPENLSVHEFKTVLDDELHEMYEREKEEKIRNLKENNKIEKEVKK